MLLKLLYLSLLLFASLVRGQERLVNVKECPNPLPDPNSDWSKYGMSSLSPFVLDSGRGSPKQQTTVHLCHASSLHALLIKFDCVDNNAYNSYTQCNDPLYKEDVVEFFLAKGDAIPHRYLELEVAPSGALFAATIDNPELTCNGIQDHLIPCNETGIKWEVHVNETSNHWFAYLNVPLSLVDSTMDDTMQQSVYRGNFYRIDTPLNDYKEYSCWSPTMAEPACFHKPKYFGTINLV